MKVIFLGTSSGAGKTTVTAMYCRYLKRKGVNVAPFKALNLSLRSSVTKDGLEIGTGQALQAIMSEIEPNIDMNPILLKPSGNGKIRTIVNGEEWDTSIKTNGAEASLKKACAAFDRLSAGYEAVVCEGSGSPVELNMMDRDIANIGIMRERKIPAVLVGDIERGGVFAALYGTWLLMPEDVRPLLKGFIINRFRGDPSILAGAIDRIEKLTGMRFIGTIPYADVKFPEEDSLSENGDGSYDNTAEALIKRMDSLLSETEKYGFDMGKIKDISSP
ncbi:MAG: cobyric acid synthase [Candidatus Methanoplasma sp.]|jgi:adenosylcobyric acid synthase|nr:cobyric acid synthase [Candidatus Methanoplasma sp.]